MNLHTPSFLQGLEVGRRLKARRLQRQPVAYLYNGVRLPKLPEWDETVYPYAIITLRNGGYVFRVTTTPFAKGISVSNWVDGATHAYISYNYNADNNAWEYGKTGETFVGLFSDTEVVWASHDIRYEDDYTPAELAGTIYLAASEPVPVYE